jgi:GNAT superfamily N-acetyltransferase
MGTAAGGIRIVPAEHDHLAAAAELLAARQRRAVAVEPLLPAEFTEPAGARRVLDAAWAADARGAVALRGEDLVGVMLGTIGVDPVRGRVAWSRYGWHAIAEDLPDGGELYRDLYAAVSPAWVDGGHFEHLVVVPAADGAALAAFAALGFGHQQAHAVRETTADGSPVERPAGVEIRRAGPGDLDLVLTLAEVISRHQAGSPTYQPSLPEWRQSLADGYRETLELPEATTILALRDGRAVGLALLHAEAPDDTDALRPTADIYLEIAVTRPEERGAGIGLALTAEALRTAHELGARVCATDWRTSNLLSSRFWPRRGFRLVALRLARSVDPRIAWARA